MQHLPGKIIFYQSFLEYDISGYSNNAMVVFCYAFVLTFTSACCKICSKCLNNQLVQAAVHMEEIS